MTLISRLEQAEAGSRELDLHIAVAIDWRWDEWEDDEPTLRTMIDKHSWSWMLSRMGDSLWRMVPHYTTSIDAAMSLVPEDHHWAIGQETSFAWATVEHWSGSPHFEASAVRTPALALCVASLKAAGYE